MKTMKKITAFCFALSLSAMIFTSCSKEAKLEKRLTGTWNVSSYEGDGSSDDSGTNKTSSTAKVEISASNAGSYTFEDDGTGTYNLTYDMKMTEEVSGTVTEVHVSNSGSFEWKNDDKTVTISYKNGDQDVYTIDTNEKSQQVWSGTSDQTVTQGVDVGVSVNNTALDLSLNVKMTLNKE